MYVVAVVKFRDATYYVNEGTRTFNMTIEKVGNSNGTLVAFMRFVGESALSKNSYIHAHNYCTMCCGIM